MALNIGTNEKCKHKEGGTAFDLDAFNRAKEERHAIVLDLVASHCTSDSPFEDLCRIAASLQNGDHLQIENLSGGYTNYTYKLYLARHPTVALFAKLCFTRAFWNPDQGFHYDLERTDNEFAMMEQFALVAPDCVATPYLLLDMEDGKSKLLVAKWAPADEQFGNQFIDGVVDPRLAKTLATSLASLHCLEIDPDFNSNSRECMINVFPIMKQTLLNKLQLQNGNADCGDENRSTQLVKELGLDFCNTIFDVLTENYQSQDITCHGDLHLFNVLVERKPDVQRMEDFGPNGTLVYCDWEMTMRGPIGLDIGRVYSIPIASVLAHAISGNEAVVRGLQDFMSEVWTVYSNAMKNAGRDEDFLLESYRNALAWLGWKLLGMCTFDWFVPFLPVNEKDVLAFKDSLCVVSLKLMRWGFAGHEKGLSMTELQSRFHGVIEHELSLMRLKSQIVVKRRRSSVLRETGRRVSDAFIGMGSVGSFDVSAFLEAELVNQT